MKAIMFRVGEREFGVDVRQVRSIERMGQVTVVPGAPTFVRGVTDLRGDIVPVVDLRARLGLQEAGTDLAPRLIVVRLDGRDIAFQVDAANDVVDLDDHEVVPAPTALAGREQPHIRGVAKVQERLLVLLDMEHVLDGDDVSMLQVVLPV